MTREIDSRGRSIELATAPRRIVSLVPSQSELLAELGLDDEVLGITRFCVHPRSWRQRKSIVGGTKDVAIDRVRSLQPDLVLANLEENTREIVEALDEFAPVYVTDVKSVTEALSMIHTVGRLCHRSEMATSIAKRVESGFAQLGDYSPLRTVYLIWRRPFMTVGGDTFIHDVMRHAGLVNMFGHERRYPELSSEDLAAVDPELLLLSSEPYPFTADHAEELASRLPTAQVLLANGEMFSWYGSRLLLAPRYLRYLREKSGLS